MPIAQVAAFMTRQQPQRCLQTAASGWFFDGRLEYREELV
jgi:hypothetical protein